MDQLLSKVFDAAADSAATCVTTAIRQTIESAKPRMTVTNKAEVDQRRRLSALLDYMASDKECPLIKTQTDRDKPYQELDEEQASLRKQAELLEKQFEPERQLRAAIDRMRTVADRKFQVSREPAYNGTPMFIAIAKGNPDMVKLLMDKGIAVTPEMISQATDIAAHYPDYDKNTLYTLLQSEAIPSQQTFNMMIDNGMDIAVGMSIEKGLRPTAEKFEEAVRKALDISICENGFIDSSHEINKGCTVYALLKGGIVPSKKIIKYAEERQPALMTAEGKAMPTWADILSAAREESETRPARRARQQAAGPAAARF